MILTPEAARARSDAGASGVPSDSNGILQVSNFLSDDECARLIERAEAQPREDGKIRRMAEHGQADMVDEQAEFRITTTIKTFDIADEVVPFVGRAFFDQVGPHFGVEFEWFEFPDILRYDPGGHYHTHNDSELWDETTGCWRLGEDRQFSLLIYLNEDFIGGAIDFPEAGISIQPEPGLLVAFPSDHRFAHTALPVEQGTRYAVVSWGATVGAPRLQHGMRGGVVYTARSHVPFESMSSGPASAGRN